MAISGLDRLQRKLQVTIPNAVVVRVKEALARSADEVVAAMRSLVPVESGDLRDSIAWTWGDAPKGTIAIASKKAKGSDLRITIYAGGGEAYYGRFVEFGTNPHTNGGLFAGARHPGTAAKPFFYPGWRMSKKAVKSRVSRSIKKAIKEGVA